MILFLFVSFSLHPLPPKRPQQRPPGLLAACCWKKRARTARGASADPPLLGEGPVPAARTPWEGVATRAGGASSLPERWRQQGARQAQSPPGTSSGRQGAWLHTSSWTHMQPARPLPPFQPQLPYLQNGNMERLTRLV